jgi:hypothetical protein
VTSALALGESLGPGEIAALIFTLGGVAFATHPAATRTMDAS